MSDKLICEVCGYPAYWHGSFPNACPIIATYRPRPSLQAGEGAREIAKQLLADAVGIPLRSNTDLDLSDQRRVSVEEAFRAIERALSLSAKPEMEPSDES